MKYYLVKVFVIIEHNSKNLSCVLNEVKKRVHAIDIHDSDYVMACYIEIRFVASIIKKSHMISYLHYDYIHNFYQNKQESSDDMFCQ